MKCLTYGIAEERYGGIDFSTAHWPNQKDWIQPLKIPTGMFPNWRVLNTSMPVRTIACNLDMVNPLWKALSEVCTRGLSHELKTFDGCFNIRTVRGSHAPSLHAYGLAIDLNAADNPLGAIVTKFSKGFIACFTEQGFSWGGNFHHRKDPMHFSYGWE